MNKIVSKEYFSPNVVKLEVEAPLIAKARRAGHFVIVRVGEKGERIPLTIAGADVQRGTITLVVQRVGVSSDHLCALEVGDELTDLVGPLGRATHIDRFGTVVCACGGVGAAPMLPIAEAMKAAGNRVITVLAARTKELIILEEQLRRHSDEVVVMTDDGSYGTQGLVTAGVEAIIRRERVDLCVTVGPAVMMKFVSQLTKQYGIPTVASLNTIMVDGTGMCGACRVTVGGKTRFVCVDGPEFDAHQVDFDEMLMRLRPLKSSSHPNPQRPLNSPQGGAFPHDKGGDTTIIYNEETTSSPSLGGVGEASASPLKPRDRVAIPRVRMPEQAPGVRNKNNREVNLGLTPQMAMREAQRCLDCRNPTCVTGCPVGVDIPRFIKHIERGDFLDAARVLKETSALPAVCGRVCPQEKQCESKCIHLKMGKEAVAIGYLERFAADYERESGQASVPQVAAPNGKKVAVVGSGPAGLSFAGDMAKLGYEVTVFEALHEIGGVLKYGIPEFRLPNRIVDFEIDNLRHMGVRFMADTIVGKTFRVDELREAGYCGIFVGSGAGLPRFMGCPGENLVGIMSSNEYLTRVNLMHAAEPDADTPVIEGKRVAVIGGGNTAMDSVRTAKRLGAERALIVYRRSEDEMPARAEEIKHAKEEGVEFLTLHNPIAYEGDERGQVRRMLLQVMELGEPDASGRRSPVPVEGRTEWVDVDEVIVSIGVSPNPLIPRSVEGLNVSKWGTIEVNPDTMQSSLPMLFAGGDIVRGGATVILAMGDGRRAARAMHEWLEGKAQEGA